MYIPEKGFTQPASTLDQARSVTILSDAWQHTFVTKKKVFLPKNEDFRRVPRLSTQPQIDSVPAQKNVTLAEKTFSLETWAI